MLQFILMIVGISYWFRRPKLKGLTAEQFPGLPPETLACG